MNGLMATKNSNKVYSFLSLTEAPTGFDMLTERAARASNMREAQYAQ